MKIEIIAKNPRAYMQVFNSRKLAKEALNKSKCFWMILGDNGQYWVPQHNRMCAELVRAGYEKAEDCLG
jgi:exosome complex RNA-binding protein Rrp4